jgi:hypothetical protein
MWKFDTCCRNENAAVQGAKKPDARGMTPVGGAY